MILGTVWSLTPAREVLETFLALVPCVLFVASSLISTLLFDGWIEFVAVLVGQLLSLSLMLSIGHRIRDRRMREIIEAA
ncbi:MAG: hypothetical protein H6718_17790 [Polyangiaceae bacterium]|nr:hypothetical protein [Polyangiaceae bacterium]